MLSINLFHQVFFSFILQWENVIRKYLLQFIMYLEEKVPYYAARVVQEILTNNIY